MNGCINCRICNECQIHERMIAGRIDAHFRLEIAVYRLQQCLWGVRSDRGLRYRLGYNGERYDRNAEKHKNCRSVWRIQESSPHSPPTHYIKTWPMEVNSSTVDKAIETGMKSDDRRISGCQLIQFLLWMVPY